MRSCLAALCLASLPLAASADSVHTLEVINDTRSSIDSFAVAPAEALWRPGKRLPRKRRSTS